MHDSQISLWWTCITYCLDIRCHFLCYSHCLHNRYIIRINAIESVSRDCLLSQKRQIASRPDLDRRPSSCPSGQSGIIDWSALVSHVMGKKGAYDLSCCHTKRKIGKWGPAIPSFGMTLTTARYNFIVGVIPIEGLARPHSQSFFEYHNDKDPKACFPMTRLLCLAIHFTASDRRRISLLIYVSYIDYSMFLCFLLFLCSLV